MATRVRRRRVICPSCKRPGRALTGDGRLYPHKPWGSRFSGGWVQDCRASGQPYEQPAKVDHD